MRRRYQTNTRSVLLPFEFERCISQRRSGTRRVFPSCVLLPSNESDTSMSYERIVRASSRSPSRSRHPWIPKHLFFFYQLGKIRKDLFQVRSFPKRASNDPSSSISCTSSNPPKIIPSTIKRGSFEEGTFSSSTFRSGTKQRSTDS